MGHLEGISVEDLHEALEEVEGKRPTQRLLAAIAYKNGVTQTELAEWHGVRRRTIYNWLRRLEREPIVSAVRDDRRPGRPRKLSDEQRALLGRTLHDSPGEAGYDAAEWTPRLVRRYVAETFDVDYSTPSCRRLLREAGLRYRRSDPPSTGDGSSGREPDDGVGGTGENRWTTQ